MKTRLVTIIAISLIAFAAIALVRSLSRARMYSGPGLQGNLLKLELAKARWLDEHRDGDEWPGRDDLLPYLTNGTQFTSFDEVIRPRDREIYIINRTGAPVLAYDPRSERLITLHSNVVPQFDAPK